MRDARSSSAFRPRASMIIITKHTRGNAEKAANEKLEECYHDRPPLPFDGNGGRSPIKHS